MLRSVQSFTWRKSTVKSHINAIFAKLHLRDRVHAVIFGYEFECHRGDRGEQDLPHPAGHVPLSQRARWAAAATIATDETALVDDDESFTKSVRRVKRPSRARQGSDAGSGRSGKSDRPPGQRGHSRRHHSDQLLAAALQSAPACDQATPGLRLGSSAGGHQLLPAGRHHVTHRDQR